MAELDLNFVELESGVFAGGPALPSQIVASEYPKMLTVLRTAAGKSERNVAIYPIYKPAYRLYNAKVPTGVVIAEHWDAPHDIWMHHLSPLRDRHELLGIHKISDKLWIPGECDRTAVTKKDVAIPREAPHPSVIGRWEKPDWTALLKEAWAFWENMPERVKKRVRDRDLQRQEAFTA